MTDTVGTNSIFANKGIYEAWLQASDEHRVLERWLQANLRGMQVARLHDQTVRVVDFGCGRGSTSVLLVGELLKLGLKLRYTGVDPVQEQFGDFIEQLQDIGFTNFNVLQGRIADFKPGGYDLAFVCQALSYVEDLHEDLHRVTNRAQEIIIVHQGEQGLNTIRNQFFNELRPDLSAISTGRDIRMVLGEIDIGTRVITHTDLNCVVDVRACVDPNSEVGQNLISFMLERPFEDLAPKLVADVRAFIKDTYGPNDYIMAHDLGVIVIA